MFSYGTGLCQASAFRSLRIFGAASVIILYAATITPANAFPRPADPLAAPTKPESRPESDTLLHPESPAQPDAGDEEDVADADTSIDEFLDKLMMAESGGRAKAKNPRSSALGPYQFINSTFIEVVDRHFSDEVEGLSRSQILALRTDMEFARRAATAFNNDNANYLRERGVAPTFAHLRVSYLLGAPGAVDVLRAKPDTPLTKVLPNSVIRANPFMRRLTVAGLVDRAEREVGVGTWTVSNEVAQSATEFSTAETEEQDAAPAAKEKPAKTAPASNDKPEKSEAADEDKRAHALPAGKKAAAPARSVTKKVKATKMAAKSTRSASSASAKKQTAKVSRSTRTASTASKGSKVASSSKSNASSKQRRREARNTRGRAL